MAHRHSSPSLLINTSFHIHLVERNASTDYKPNKPQLEYAKWTVYFYCFWIIVFTFVHLSRLVPGISPKSKNGNEIRYPLWSRRSTAMWRFVAYRRMPGPVAEAIGIPSFGIVAFLSLGSVFVIAMTFAQTPYLPPESITGPPPLSLRCAMIISALMPLIIALASKINPITVLTAISYEKLNIFHRFAGYVFLALATVHTIPHLYVPVKNGGWAMIEGLFKENMRHLSGAILYGAVFGLIFLTAPYIRKHAYEIFAYTHIALSFIVLGLFYWHIEGEFMSPNYWYAAVAIGTISTLARIVRYTVVSRLWQCHLSMVGYPATLQHLAGKTTRMAVKVPRNLKWHPGQHAYIRVPQISTLDNHPFTITSIPYPTGKGKEGRNEMVFVIRARAGFTHALWTHAQTDAATTHVSSGVGSSTDLGSQNAKSGSAKTLNSLDSGQKCRHSPGFNVLIDGPYGSHIRHTHKFYDTVICVAGGSGITAVLPWLLDYGRKMRDQSTPCSSSSGHLKTSIGETCLTKKVHLIWMIRSENWINWVRNEIVEALDMVAGLQGVAIEVNAYVTALSGNPQRDRAIVAHSSVACLEPTTQLDHGSVGSGIGVPGLNIHFIRPILSQVIEESIKGSTRALIISCGPHALKVELSNSVARLQRHVLRGDMNELSLRTETFAW